MSYTLLLLLASFAILYFGAELALSGSEKIGKSIGLSPLAIGMLLVGLGTSLPEFFVSHLACLRGASEIAIGNIIGSNLANTYLILGIAGLIIPISLTKGNTSFQLIIHLVLAVILILFFIPNTTSYLLSLLLIAFFLFFLWSIYSYKKKSKADDSVDRDPPMSTTQKINSFAKLILGFFSLYYGGEVLVSSGTQLCLRLAIPSYVLSVILVAFGTSFPELATTLVAVIRKKDTNIIIGNIIGSNIFNVAFVLGTVGFYKIDISSDIKIELLAILASAIILLILSKLKLSFSRLYGVIFLLTYIGLIVFWSTKI